MQFKCDITLTIAATRLTVDAKVILACKPVNACVVLFPSTFPLACLHN